MLKIDSHTHILPKKLPNWSEKFGYGDFIYLQHHKRGYAKMMRGNQFFREIKENAWNPDLRIKEYEKFNTQVQVVCTIPVMFSYWAKAYDCLEVSKFLNDHIADLVIRYPQNYLGLATIPMQDSELAIQELERVKELGLQGIQIGSNVNDLNLNEERFFPIFQACEKLSMAILVHPWNMMGQQHMQRYWLPWLVGMPAETSRAICSMIFGGVLKSFPKLKIAFAHGGGSFPFTIGRIEHGYECRPDLVAIDNHVDPRNYLGSFWVDSLVHDPLMLDYLVKLAGADKVALGTDYPFPLGELEPGKLIESMPYSQEMKDLMLHGAALNWLGMSKEQFMKNLPKTAVVL